MWFCVFSNIKNPMLGLASIVGDVLHGPYVASSI